MSAAPPQSVSAHGIRARALILGLILAVALCVLTPVNNIYRQASPLGGGHFPLAPFVALIVLSSAVGAMRRLFKNEPWLNGRELLAIWMLMVLVSGIAYTGLVRTLFLNLTVPQHFATAENRWAELLQPLIPTSWMPHDRQAVESLYNGLPGARQLGWLEVVGQIPWAAWLAPLLTWGLFVALVYGAMICLVAILSHQALENERLGFPLLEVPQSLTSALDEGRLGRWWSDRFLLLGLSVPLALHLINGLHSYFAQVPEIPTLWLAGAYFPKQGLFSGFAKLKLQLFPLFIGFAFLAARQVSLSFWLFFLLGGLLYGLLGVLGYNIPAAALGVTFGPSFARPEEAQMIGAYIAFFLFLLWLARHHLLNVTRRGLGLGLAQQAEAQGASPWPLWGLLAALAGLLLWFWHFGIPLLAAAAILAACFLTTLVASRVICQGGLAYFTLATAPLDGLLALLGPGFFAASGLLAAAVSQKVLFLDLREALMPSLFHGRKVTWGGRGRTGRIVAVTALTLLLGVSASVVAMLALLYRYGARELSMDWATRTSLSVYENLAAMVESPAWSGTWVTVFVVVGALAMLLLVTCYHRFFWWPIHPIGYLTAYSSAMRLLWASCFIGWLCNALCMRYGGVALFRRVRLFFIGLILGDLLMAAAWASVGFFAEVSYRVLPE